MSWWSILASAASGGQLSSRAQRYFFLAPDNGVLTYIFDEEQLVEVREIDQRKFRHESPGRHSTVGIFLLLSRPDSPKTNRLSRMGRSSEITGPFRSLNHVGSRPSWSVRLSTWTGSEI